jgi:excisionase family DNA binding protein
MSDSSSTHAEFDLANRLALRPAEAALALGVSERTLRGMLSRLPCIREGGAVLIPVDSLREWLKEQAQTQGRTVDAAVQEAMPDLSGD